MCVFAPRDVARGPAAAQLPLPPQARKWHLREEEAGSMSRPLFKGIVFGEGLDLIVVEFGARQDA